jgi:hypothetical protein
MGTPSHARLLNKSLRRLGPKGPKPQFALRLACSTVIASVAIMHHPVMPAKAGIHVFLALALSQVLTICTYKRMHWLNEETISRPEK